MQQDPLVNQQLDIYHIQYRMRDGGMSMVYKAFDMHRQQDVVIKVLHERYADNAEIRERFEREISIAKALHHTYIVPFYGFGTLQGRPYIALRYMAGGTLNDVMHRGQPVPMGDAVRWLRQIAAALDYAHHKGIIHRDIKPGNVLLDEEGNICLSDFGIARVLDATQLTRADVAMPGTARFMSPEQVTGAHPLDARSDVYALAVLAYMMTAGDYPFDGPNDFAIVMQHVEKPPTRPSLLNPSLPRAVDKVILRGLAKKPSQRHASAGAFARDFAQAVAGHALDATDTIDPVYAAPFAQPDTQSYRTGLQRVRRWLGILVVGVAGLAGALLIAISGLTLLGGTGDDGPPRVVEVSATPAAEAAALTTAPTATAAILPADIPAQGDMVIPPTVTAAPTVTLATTPTPTPTVEVPNDWTAGTQLFIQYLTGISLFVGGEPVDPTQFEPGDVVTISRGPVEGGAAREWYGGPEDRWWHIALRDGGGGWLPESALGTEAPPPDATAPVRTPWPTLPAITPASTAASPVEVTDEPEP
ncbi:MAG: protein kinase domain-containing protein [Chloroflexota bacterium]